MFCAFEGPPRIVRIHGIGEVITAESAEFEALRDRFAHYESARAVIRVQALRVSDSCGYGVPLYDFRGERDQLVRWAERKGAEGLADYQRERNARSLDDLPGLLGDDEHRD